jgi:hypothetical protein
MTDEEFVALYEALTEEHRAMVLDMIDRLLTEQLAQEEQMSA